MQSSRRLEREAGRNLEVIWLTGRLGIRRLVPADGAAGESERCDRDVCIYGAR
jgi:hypothetical protein